jgi:hypothetical protein
MRRQRSLLFGALVLTLGLAAPTARPAGFIRAELPARLTDQEFWKLSTEMSEPDGNFRSENMVSNEMVFARLLPEVIARTPPNGVYLGVGPEQNFTYIAATRPRMAFITDIRRGNLHVLLMYKALFELSADRAEFISRLFTKTRPATVSRTSTPRQIMDAYSDAPTNNEAAFQVNLNAVLQQLTKTHAIPLNAGDRQGVTLAYRTFYFYGPGINYSASTSLSRLGGGNSATYWDLMTQTDESGQPLGYLKSEESFQYLKDFNSRNLLVPLVGNFSGPKAIRAIGNYVRAQGATVSTFYVSTVEHYLRDDGSLPTFCANVASLPTTDKSVFIRPGNIGQFLQSTAPATRAAAESVTGVRGIGTYQIGIVVPITGGCG